MFGLFEIVWVKWDFSLHFCLSIRFASHEYWVMQTFESFLTVYRFFLHSHFDKNYVGNIDKEIEGGSPSKETKKLIENVKAFHDLRGSLCNKIKEHLNYNAILTHLQKASGLVQYNFVPANSTCYISSDRISGSQGILLMINSSEPFTVHNRYKVFLYYFWVLVHLPKEIPLETNRWFKKQNHELDRRFRTAEERVEYIVNYQQKVFSKKHYLKLKNIAHYIQRQFPSVRINVPREDVNDM